MLKDSVNPTQAVQLYADAGMFESASLVSRVFGVECRPLVTAISKRIVSDGSWKLAQDFLEKSEYRLLLETVLSFDSEVCVPDWFIDLCGIDHVVSALVQVGAGDVALGIVQRRGWKGLRGVFGVVKDMPGWNEIWEKYVGSVEREGSRRFH